MIGSRLSDIIVKTTIPDNLFADIKDKVASIEKTKENHFGHELAGNVFEAFKLDADDIVLGSGAGEGMTESDQNNIIIGIFNI